jgi:hypothetical protein
MRPSEREAWGFAIFFAGFTVGILLGRSSVDCRTDDYDYKVITPDFQKEKARMFVKFQTNKLSR